jgi:UDP-glucose 4-epimerase
MRVVITGATGNVGTAVVAALHGAGFELVGLSRRDPPAQFPVARFVTGDVATADLEAVFAGSDAVVHLAWQIQPSRDRERVWRTNVLGTRRVLDAALAARVPRLVVASSIGVYGPGPKDDLVDEQWPTSGIRSSSYSVHKAVVEGLLDTFEEAHPEVRVIRMRPALIFQYASASQQRRLFAGPFVVGRALRPTRLVIVPDIAGLRFQAVHASDVAEAYRLAVTMPEANGAYNVAAGPVLDMPTIARFVGAATLRIPRALARPAFAAAYTLRLHPSEPGWLDLALESPLVSSARITAELGWSARRSALETISEVLEGVADGAGERTPPLAPDAGLTGRARELAEGIGARERAPS